MQVTQQRLSWCSRSCPWRAKRSLPRSAGSRVALLPCGSSPDTHSLGGVLALLQKSCWRPLLAARSSGSVLSCHVGS